MIDTDVDEMAVVRAVAGDLSVPLSRAELAAAYAQCEVLKMSASAIAERLGVAERSIVRWRSGRHPSSRKAKTTFAAMRRGD